jgi:hypothetical protein
VPHVDAVLALQHGVGEVLGVGEHKQPAVAVVVLAGQLVQLAVRQVLQDPWQAYSSGWQQQVAELFMVRSMPLSVWCQQGRSMA